MNYNKTVIIINGEGGVGKDWLISSLPEQDKIFNFSTIDIYKKIAEYLGWMGTKAPRDRKFLADLKKLSIEYNDFSFRDTINTIRWFYKNEMANLMFIHCREPKEITKLEGCAVDIWNTNFRTLLIDSPYIIDSRGLKNWVYDYHYDITFMNDKNAPEEMTKKSFLETIEKLCERI